MNTVNDKLGRYTFSINQHIFLTSSVFVRVPVPNDTAVITLLRRANYTGGRKSKSAVRKLLRYIHTNHPLWRAYSDKIHMMSGTSWLLTNSIYGKWPMNYHRRKPL